MAICPDCENTLNIDLEDVEEGETIICDECGTEFEVVGTEPLELSKVEDEGYEDEDSSTFAAEEEE
jgi:alpha-aminoadipate/glutamate carrier protein LysW